MTETHEPSWIDDPDTILFVTDDESVAAGAVEQHRLGEATGRLFGRAKTDVKAEWTKAVDQMRFLLDGLGPSTHGYEASEVTFKLAFTAKGGVAFIAEAGVSTSVSVTFHRTSEQQGTEAQSQADYRGGGE